MSQAIEEKARELLSTIPTNARGRGCYFDILRIMLEMGAWSRQQVEAEMAKTPVQRMLIKHNTELQSKVVALEAEKERLAGRLTAIQHVALSVMQDECYTTDGSPEHAVRLLARDFVENKSKLHSLESRLAGAVKAEIEYWFDEGHHVVNNPDGREIPTGRVLILRDEKGATT